MNFYIIAFVLSWLMFILFGNKKLWKWGVLAGTVGFIHEISGIGLGIWSYDNNILAVLSNALGVYPVTGMLLLTFLPGSLAGRAVYVLAWTVVSSFLELIYVFLRHLSYIKWLAPYSVLLYAGTYTLFIAVYIYFTRARQEIM
jgi:hypothetical protein